MSESRPDLVLEAAFTSVFCTDRPLGYDLDMLLSFRCANFRSISDEQEISLIAQNNRTQEHDESLLDVPAHTEKALRCAAIYGPNASGKSNLLLAMNTFRDMIADSQRKWKPTGEIPVWDPFALNEISKSTETRFEAEISVEQNVYLYSVSFNSRVITKEVLVDITKRPKMLFRRSADNSTISVTFPGRNLADTTEDQKHLDLIKIQTRPNSLFLSSAAQSNFERLTAIYKWITESFQILSPAVHATAGFTAGACSDPMRKQQIQALLAFADTGIVGLEIIEEDAPERERRFLGAVLSAYEREIESQSADLRVPERLVRHNIKMLHRGPGGHIYPLPFEQESAGTKAYFYMLGPLINELEQGTVLLIDELESSLHPNLARQFVRIFNDPTLNPKGAQLVFATHDTNLLDLELVRRDQVWFTEKNQQGSTAVSQLSDFKPRKEQNVAFAYLHGRFGGTPFLDEDLLRSAFLPKQDRLDVGEQ